MNWRFKGPLGLLACLVVLGVIANAIDQKGAQQPSTPAAPISEPDQAVEQCEAAIARSYGLSSILSGPTASDKWRDHRGTGGYNSLWTVSGKNAFGMPAENVIECEAGTKMAGSWTVPVLWNVTLNGDKLDPGMVDHPTRRSHRHHAQGVLQSK